MAIAALNKQKESSFKITTAVAEGVKIGIAEARENKHYLSKQIRDSITKLQPAHLDFLQQPSNAFQCTYSNEVLNCLTTIVNTGDYPAYSLLDSLYLIFLIDGYPPLLIIDTTGRAIGQDLDGKGSTRINSIDVPIPLEQYNATTKIYCVIKGRYYSEIEPRNPIYFQRAKVYAPREGLHFNYDISMPISDFLKKYTLDNP